MNADRIIAGKYIFDSIHATPFSGFVALKGNRILAVERDQGLLKEYRGSETRLMDAGDCLVMPSFFDSHTHVVLAGMYQQCVNLGEAKSEEEAAAQVAAYAKSIPGQEWVIGFNWYHVFWKNRKLPDKASLDAVVRDRPVFLVNAEAHGAWANSLALSMAGITKDTPDPPYGVIHRNQQGEATGFLEEAALGIVGRMAFDFSPSQEKQYIEAYQKSAAASGITSVKDMQPYFGRNLGSLDVYESMDQRGELTVRIFAAPDLLGDLGQALQWRQRFSGGRVRVNHLKQFMDGVSTTHTALMLEEYSDGSPGDKGKPLVDLAALKKAIIEAHRHGFGLCLHSCGDRSARLALDYIEEAVRIHGRQSMPHCIEHNELVDPADMPRYKALSVIPSVMPEHLAMTRRFDETPFRVVMGEERASRMFAFKSLLESAGVLAIGSDCPVVSLDPFLEIYRAVTRLHNDGEPKGGWTPSEKLTMEEVLRAYTVGSACSAGAEAQLGTLEKGKLADLIILDRNLFTTPPEKIRDTKVLMTMIEGDVVYRDQAYQEM